jgi:uncharacterized protein
MHKKYNAIFHAIYQAIEDGNLPEVIRLIGTDTKILELDTPLGTWLHVAAEEGRLEIVRWLLSKGIDVNARGKTIERRPLDEAAANGHFQVAKCLVDAGASLDVSESVRNPLFSAIVGGLSKGHTEIAKLLIERGIDTTIRYPNLKNMNALEFADEWGREDVVKLLKKVRRK